MSNHETPLIELKDVAKAYYNIALLEGVNLSVMRGDSIAFTGRNGAGKSTLIKIAVGLVRPSAGQIRHRDNLAIAYVPEHFPAMNLTAEQYIESMGRLSGIAASERKERSEHLFEEFFMDDMKKKPMKHLSKGTLQKVGVIQALMENPDVLVLDEPLSGQDAKSQYVFIEKVNHLRENGTAIMMSCHEPHLIRRIVNRVYLIENNMLKETDLELTADNSKYILFFEAGESARLPGESIQNLVKTENGYRIEVPADESRAIILLMLQSGWELRGMYHEDDL